MTRASLLLLGALVSGACGGAPGTAIAQAPAPAVEDDRFVRVVNPFPVSHAEGEPYRFPFLGGFDVPRPQFVDMDGDGDLDLFVQERTGSIIHFENVGERGAPVWEWRTNHFRGLDTGEWGRFADLDGDGDFDLLAELRYSYVRYFRNVGGPRDPRFETVDDSVMTAAGEPLFSDRQNIPSIADVDCDGVPDLFLGRIDGTVARYELVPGSAEEGVPVFELRSERFEDIEIVAQIGGQQPSVRHGANSMAFTDWDGDGDLDLLWGDFFEPSILFIENTGGCPNFDLRSEPRPVRTVAGDTLLTSGYNAPAPVDLDADGHMDLVVGILGGAFNPARTAADNLVYWARTDEGLLRKVPERFVDQLDLGSETIPGLADLDGDGDLDLLVGNRIGARPMDRSQVFRFENVGSAGEPRFRLTDTLGLDDSYHYAPAPRDMDGDGDPDLVLGTWNDDVLLYWNVGTAAAPVWDRAEEPLVVLTRGSHATPAFGDVDGDGDADLFVGESSGELNYFRNVGSEGDPRFELVSDVFGGFDVGRRSHPTLFDWDADGDLDLLVGSEAPGLVLFRNEGGERFVEVGRVLTEAVPPFASPRFVDLDGDGVAELLSGDLSGGLAYLEDRGGR